MAENRQYDHEYKVQAVKLAKEIGQAKAAKELGVPKNTMYGWVRANRLGSLDLGAGSQTPKSAMTLNEELLQLRQQVKEQEKEIRRLKKENDFLEEASAFFRREPSEVSKNERMKFIALKTKDGELNTVLKKEHDGRISRDNKAWAKTIPMPEDGGDPRHSYVLVVDKVNPGLTDLFLKQARQVLQAPEKGSVLEKLKQEPPERKPAAPKKREPER